MGDTIENFKIGISATKIRLKMKTWQLGHSQEVNYIKICPKCVEIKDFKQIKVHLWPKEKEPWIKVMDTSKI